MHDNKPIMILISIRWPPLSFAGAVGRPVRGYSRVWALLVVVGAASRCGLKAGLSVFEDAARVLPFDGDVAGGFVRGWSKRPTGQTGACAAVLWGLYFRAIAGFLGKSPALDASKANDDGIQGRALGFTSFLKTLLLNLFGPSFAPVRPSRHRWLLSCGELLEKSSIVPVCVYVLSQWIVPRHLTSLASLLADALPLSTFFVDACLSSLLLLADALLLSLLV